MIKISNNKIKIMTFDIEDWFHIIENEYKESENNWDNYNNRVEKNIDKILDLLDENNIQATFFSLGWIGDKYPQLLKKIQLGGHEIGSHSYAHTLVYKMKKDEFEEDLKRSIYTIEDAIGEKVTLYRAPGFSITKNEKWVFPLLIKYGIKFDCSVMPLKASYGGYDLETYNTPFSFIHDNQSIKEFPMSIKNYFFFKLPMIGGGYFRLFPWWQIKNAIKNQEYLMTYFHPRDFDHEQPILANLGLLRKFKSYHGLKNSMSKFKLLLNSFNFYSIGQINKTLNWEELPKVEL